MADPTTIFHHLQRQLFPALGAEFGALSALDQQFSEVMALTESGPSPAVGMVWQRRSAMSAHPAVVSNSPRAES